MTYYTQYQSVNEKLQNVKNVFVTINYIIFSTLTPKVTKLQSYRGKLSWRNFLWKFISVSENPLIICYYCNFIYIYIIYNKIQVTK